MNDERAEHAISLPAILALVFLMNTVAIVVHASHSLMPYDLGWGRESHSVRWVHGFPWVSRFETYNSVDGLPWEAWNDPDFDFRRHFSWRSHHETRASVMTSSSSLCRLGFNMSYVLLLLRPHPIGRWLRRWIDWCGRADRFAELRFVVAGLALWVASLLAFEQALHVSGFVPEPALLGFGADHRF